MRPKKISIAAALAVLSAAGVIAATTSSAGASAAKPADWGHSRSVIVPGDVLVSESHYLNDPGLVAGATILPPRQAQRAPRR